MPLKPQTAEEPGLNLTPMIDIVFLLIIFFMVGARFTEEDTEYEVELPTVSEAQPLTSLPDELVINIMLDGKVIVKGKELTMEELESILVEARKNYSEQSVLVRGAGEGTFQNVMSVLEICNRAKISNVSLANRVASGG